jgi:hypothetical protein
MAHRDAIATYLNLEFAAILDLQDLLRLRIPNYTLAINGNYVGMKIGTPILRL